MTFTNDGKNRITELFYNDLGYGELGNGTTSEAVTDTNLASSITGTNLTLTRSLADKQVITDYTLPSTTAVGSTMSEFGVFSTGNVLYSRFLFGSLVHSSTEQWQFSTRHWVN